MDICEYDNPIRKNWQQIIEFGKIDPDIEEAYGDNSSW